MWWAIQTHKGLFNVLKHQLSHFTLVPVDFHTYSQAWLLIDHSIVARLHFDLSFTRESPPFSHIPPFLSFLWMLLFDYALWNPREAEERMYPRGYFFFSVPLSVIPACSRLADKQTPGPQRGTKPPDFQNTSSPKHFLNSGMLRISTLCFKIWAVWLNSVTCSIKI